MVCSKKQKGIVPLYFPQFLWNVSTVLVSIFCIVNLIEVWQIPSLTFLLKLRLIIQLIFGFFFILKFVRDFFVNKKIDLILVISAIVSIYILSISLINIEPRTFGLNSVFSTAVWPPLFFGFIISSIYDKKIDFTFSTMVFTGLCILSLGSYLYLYFANKMTSAAAINSLYYFSISVLFLFSIKNKIIYLLLIIVTIGASFYFTKSTFAIAAILGVVYYFYNFISFKKPKLFNILTNILIVLIVASLIVIIILVFEKSSFVDFLYKLSNSRLDIYKDVLTKFAVSSPISMIFGHGFDGVYQAIGISSHSDYLEVLYDYGIVGLAALIFSIVMLCIKAGKIQDHKKQSTAFGFIVFACVFMTTSHVLFILKYSLLIFTLLALVTRDTTITVPYSDCKKPKIAWILAEKLPLPNVKGGGTETLLQNLIDINEKEEKYDFVIFSKYDDAAYKKSINYQHTIFYYQKDNIFTKIYDFIYHCFYKITKTFIPRHYSIINFYKRIRVFECPDICILDGNYSQFSSLEGGEKFVLYLHILPLMLKQHNGKGLVSRLDEAWVISDFVRDKMLGYVKEKDKDKIKVITNSIVLSKFNYSEVQRKELRNKFGYSDSDFVTLFCGRMDEGKGILDLVNAYKNLPNRYKLLIIGSPHFGDNVKCAFYNDLINACSTNKNIKFTGYIDNNELYKYYSSADLFCAPSKCFEAAGLVNIEAQACGLPVLTSRDGGIPQYMEDSCLYIDEYDRVRSIRDNILKLSNDNDELQLYKNKSIEHSKKFDANNYYVRFSDRIQELIFKREKSYEN